MLTAVGSTVPRGIATSTSMSLLVQIGDRIAGLGGLSYGPGKGFIERQLTDMGGRGLRFSVQRA